MPPKPTFPQPAATLPGEADLLAAVVADLSDDTAKLVYADWLDERDDPRGPFLRAFVAGHRAGTLLPPSDPFPQPWRDVVGVTLVEAARAHGFAGRTDTFLRLARPALATQPDNKPSRNLPTGASKFGGRPDLPPGGAWPVRTSGKSLAFLGQINLADLLGSVAARDLPGAGLFSVFYDLFEEGRDAEDYDGRDPDGWRLWYFPDPAGLRPRDPPSDLGRHSQFEPRRLTFAEFVTLPDLDSARGDEFDFGNDHRAADRYHNEFRAGLEWDFPAHRLLGYPLSLRDDVLKLRSARHLLTIGPEYRMPWLVGDGNVRNLYFTLDENDLRDRKFDHTRHEAQWPG